MFGGIKIRTSNKKPVKKIRISRQETGLFSVSLLEFANKLLIVNKNLTNMK